VKQWIYRVRLPSGVFVDLAFPGNAPSIARSVAEAQYGASNVLGFIGESR
jgi:hypothetical protein